MLFPKLVSPLLVAVAAMCFAGPVAAASANGNGSANPPATAAGARAAATFDLPRLKARGRPDAPGAISKAKATVDELAPQSVARAGKDQKLKSLVVDGGKSWSRPLRGGPKDTVFVSFFVYGSAGTVIDIAGARLRIVEGAKPEEARLQIGRTTKQGVTWLAFGGPVKRETHDGASLAALPVITVRLDRAAEAWDLFIGQRLAQIDLPLGRMPAGAANQFTVRAGTDGAMVCGLVSADENPLYEDENGNGIADDFEKQQGGGVLLASRAPAAERATLAQAWRQDQQRRQVKAWPVQRPLPDVASTGNSNGKR